MQISKQFKYLQNQYKRGLLFKDYQDLNENGLLSIEYEIQSAIKAKEYERAVDIQFFTSFQKSVMFYYFMNLLLLDEAWLSFH